MKTVSTQENKTDHIDQALDREFRIDFTKGRHIAEGLETGSIRANLDKIDALPTGDLTELQLATATLMLTLVNTVASLRNNNISRPSFNAYSATNQAIGDILLLAEDTSITKDILVDACVKYCHRSNLLASNGSEPELRKLIESYIEGVWCEQCFNNLALASGAHAEQATPAEDKNGVDIWLEVTQDDFVGVDVKANKRTIELFSDKKSLTLDWYEFKTDVPNSESPFTLQLAIDSTGDHIFVAIENTPRSPGISAVDFRGKIAEQSCFKELLAQLKNLVNTGKLPTYGKRTDE